MIDVIFSDIDGTCVHYDMGETLVAFQGEGLERLGLERAQFPDGNSAWVLALPESSSGSRGIISVDSLAKYETLRSLGRKVVLVSGCRFATLLQRLPYLPKADAYVCESGGRIFFPNTSNTFPGLCEDISWRNHHVGLPPKQPSAVKPEEYQEDLWSFYRELLSRGISLDTKNYSTAFRVKDDRLSPLEVPEYSPNLACSTNLGSLDVYPKTSGKLNAAKYLMGIFKVDSTRSVFMCDDDNDVELALYVSKAFLPSITSESMRTVVGSQRSHFFVANKEGIFGTEQSLDEIISMCNET
jgi:hydroxymethylpyrimidine pyrophosphatase-like HAD family hydrolase